MVKRLYDTKQWKALRRQHLTESPYCVYCKRLERLTVATVVDHVRRHNQDPTLFFDRANLQSLCKPHHDASKQRQERTEERFEVDDAGWPVRLLRPPQKRLRKFTP